MIGEIPDSQYKDTYLFVCCACAPVYRSPVILILETASVKFFSSSDVNAKSATPRFSCMCANLVVPGIGTIQGFRYRTNYLHMQENFT